MKPHEQVWAPSLGFRFLPFRMKKEGVAKNSLCTQGRGRSGGAPDPRVCPCSAAPSWLCDLGQIASPEETAPSSEKRGLAPVCSSRALAAAGQVCSARGNRPRCRCHGVHKQQRNIRFTLWGLGPRLHGARPSHTAELSVGRSDPLPLCSFNPSSSTEAIFPSCTCDRDSPFLTTLPVFPDYLSGS